MMVILTAHATAATWDTEIAPKPGDNFTEAKFRLRLDAPESVVKGLLVLSPGWNGDGRNLVDDAGWRQFAKQAGFGIIGVCLRSDEKKASVYHIVDQGSGEAFRRAVVELAKMSRHLELADAPLRMQTRGKALVAVPNSNSAPPTASKRVPACATR